MKLIVGLGNPGEKYINTRHNVGYRVVDRILTDYTSQGVLIKKSKLKSAIYTLGGYNTVVATPLTYMNESGLSVLKLMNFYAVDNDGLYVIHDDLDLTLGNYKVQYGVGPKVHRGIDSINRELGTVDYWRLRLGIDNRSGDRKEKVSGEEYVLDVFDREETEVLDSMIAKVAREIGEKILLHE